jgi:hypothetical protein
VDDVSRAVFTILCAFLEHFSPSVVWATAEEETRTVLRHLLALTFFDELDGSREVATIPLFVWGLLSEELVQSGLHEGAMEEQKPIWREVFAAFVQAARVRVQWPPKEELDEWSKSEFSRF